MFLKELAKKMLSTESIIKNLPSLISVMYNEVTTDFTLTDCVKYAGYVDDIDMDNVTMETVPGVGQYVGNVSYYVLYEDQLESVVRRTFYSDDVKDKDGHISSEGKNIEVANGTNTTGLAGKNQELLISEGFNVTAATTYQGEQQDKTRIIVYAEGMGYDLLEYYPDAEIIVDSEQLTGNTDNNTGEPTDILIILGNNDSGETSENDGSNEVSAE